MTKFVIHDTADVLIRHKASGKVILNAEAQLASISGTISEEDLRGGIGNKKLYKIRNDKDINLTVRSAFGDLEYWAMTQGATIDDAGTAQVTKFVSKVVVDNAGNLEVTGLPATITQAIIEDKDGSQDPVTVTTGVAELPTGAIAVAGDTVKVFYKETITGKKIKIEASKFSEKYEVEYRTISYNPETAEVYSDIYFLFPNTIPSGEFEISLENGNTYTPEIKFSVLTPLDSDLYAEIIEDVR